MDLGKLDRITTSLPERYVLPSAVRVVLLLAEADCSAEPPKCPPSSLESWYIPGTPPPALSKLMTLVDLFQLTESITPSAERSRK